MVADKTLYRSPDNTTLKLDTQAIRTHDNASIENYPNSQIQLLLSHIARKTFLVYLRLSTHKESPQSFITATIFGKIVYDNFLMDMPRLLDLCTLFYNDNQTLVEKMIKNVITQAEGRYDNDIMQASRTMREALLKVQQKVDILVFQTPGMISSAKNSHVHQELIDLSFYSADILQTISLFLQAYKLFCN